MKVILKVPFLQSTCHPPSAPQSHGVVAAVWDHADRTFSSSRKVLQAGAALTPARAPRCRQGASRYSWSLQNFLLNLYGAPPSWGLQGNFAGTQTPFLRIPRTFSSWQGSSFSTGQGGRADELDHPLPTSPACPAPLPSTSGQERRGRLKRRGR